MVELVQSTKNRFEKPPISNEQIEQKSSNELPPELIQKILLFLFTNALESSTQVKTPCDKVSVESGKDQGLKKIKNFVSFLNEQLDENSYPKEKEALLEILNHSNEIIVFSTTLLELKSSLLTVKDRIASILKNLTEKEIEVLRHASDAEKQNFFEDIFELAKVYKELDVANQIPDEPPRNEALSKISRQLTKIGQINKAIEAADMITSQMRHDSALFTASQALIESGRIDKAILIINRLELLKEQALVNASKALANNGDFHKAMEIANEITDEERKIEADSYIDIKLEENCPIRRVLRNVGYID